MVNSVIKENMLQIISQPSIILENSHLKSIRGNNFSNGKALFLTDNNHRSWIWKKLTVNGLLNEYIVSYFAKNIGIPIPQSRLAINNNKPGLLQEWIIDGIELTLYNDTFQPVSNKEILFLLLAFEAWVGASDRHGANYITNNQNIWAIDFENSFSHEVYGSELCLYFPWMKEYRDEIRDAAIKLKTIINKKELLKKEIIEKIISEMSAILKDKRAKRAMRFKIEEIFTFLNDNIAILEDLTLNYLEKSYSIPDLLIVG